MRIKRKKTYYTVAFSTIATASLLSLSCTPIISNSINNTPPILINTNTKQTQPLNFVTTTNYKNNTNNNQEINKNLFSNFIQTQNNTNNFKQEINLNTLPYVLTANGSTTFPFSLTSKQQVCINNINYLVVSQTQVIVLNAYKNITNNLTIPSYIQINNNRLSVVAIAPSAFLNCNLNQINLPNSILAIGSLAFANNNLSNITLPNNLIYLGNNAFANNNWNANLKIYLPNNCYWNKNANNAPFDSREGNILARNTVVYLIQNNDLYAFNAHTNAWIIKSVLPSSLTTSNNVYSADLPVNNDTSNLPPQKAYANPNNFNPIINTQFIQPSTNNSLIQISAYDNGLGNWRGVFKLLNIEFTNQQITISALNNNSAYQWTDFVKLQANAFINVYVYNAQFKLIGSCNINANSNLNTTTSINYNVGDYISAQSNIYDLTGSLINKTLKNAPNNLGIYNVPIAMSVNGDAVFSYQINETLKYVKSDIHVLKQNTLTQDAAYATLSGYGPANQQIEIWNNNVLLDSTKSNSIGLFNLQIPTLNITPKTILKITAKNTLPKFTHLSGLNPLDSFILIKTGINDINLGLSINGYNNHLELITNPNTSIPAVFKQNSYFQNNNLQYNPYFINCGYVNAGLYNSFGNTDMSLYIYVNDTQYIIPLYNLTPNQLAQKIAAIPASWGDSLTIELDHYNSNSAFVGYYNNNVYHTNYYGYDFGAYTAEFNTSLTNGISAINKWWMSDIQNISLTNSFNTGWVGGNGWIANGFVGYNTTASYSANWNNINAQMESVANALVANQPNNMAKVAAINQWIHQNMLYDPTTSLRNNNTYNWDSTAINIFNRMEGVCVDFCDVEATMLQYEGFVVRILNGETAENVNCATGYLAGMNLPLSGYHAWLQVWMPKKDAWITIDPTFGINFSNYFFMNQVWFNWARSSYTVAAVVWPQNTNYFSYFKNDPYMAYYGMGRLNNYFKDVNGYAINTNNLANFGVLAHAVINLKPNVDLQINKPQLWQINNNIFLWMYEVGFKLLF